MVKQEFCDKKPNPMVGFFQSDVKKTKRRQYNKKYRASEKGKAAEARYQAKRKLARAQEREKRKLSLVSLGAADELGLEQAVKEECGQKAWLKAADAAYEAEVVKVTGDHYWDAFEGYASQED